MKTLLRCTFMLLVLGYGVAANAQMTFTLADMTRLNISQWKYGTVTCTSPRNVTSIILSMINNQIASNSSGITPTRSIPSLGNNPRTVLYLFTPAITPTQVQNFVKGMTFTQTSEISGANPYVNISVDTNPTSLPGGGSKITEWRDHPDGSIHYYVWVPSASVHYGPAYSAAKTFYFQGMRGYMPTITSAYESSLLTQISNEQGWCGGARTATVIADTRTAIVNPVRTDSGEGVYYKWLCGPETNFKYYRGPTWNTSGAGPMGGAFSGWNPTEPNNASGENCMQVNHANLRWNDYYAHNPAIRGYFIEFGGNGKAYTVGSANYPANDLYNEAKLGTIPSGGLTNNQWHGFSPGNRIATSTTFKPNSMRSHVLVID